MVMNLEDLARFRALDTEDMMGHIYNLPDQLAQAWDLGQSLPLPESEGLRHILVAGMGGSAIGADLLAAYVSSLCPIPITVHRDYDLPAWAGGPQTLVVASSHSGNTEETLSAFQQAQERGCQTLVMTTGGRLAQLGAENAAPVWRFEHSGQPRSAVGFSFGLLLAALFRLNLLPDPTVELHEALHAMRNQQTNLLPEVPVAFNPAKRLAGQLVGRWVVVLAADYLAPVARRWKGQLNELAKAWVQFDVLPEADHNTLAGLNNPENALMNTMALFLQSPDNHRRNQLRLDYTRQILMSQGINTDIIQAKGENHLAHLWTLLHFGDYTSYYLAMAYNENPTPVDTLSMLKEELGKTSQ